MKLLACDNALEPQQRAATFEARVRPAYGSERMQVRFSLQVREGELPAGAAWSPPGSTSGRRPLPE